MGQIERTALEALVTGELLAGVRTQEDPASTPLIQSCWKVECAEAETTKQAAVISERRMLVFKYCSHR